MKVCSKCGEEKELEEFHKNKSSKDGLQSRCKVCVREYLKQWRENNPEYMKQWREENKDRVRENVKRWQRENRDRYLRKLKKWREDNPGYNKRWREENPDYDRKWRKANPEKMRTYRAIRRARKLGNLDEWDRELSAARRLAIKDDPCYYCGQRTETMHDEHYLPLSKGGTDEWFNLVRACSTCNQSKYTKCGTVFMIQEGII